MAQQGYYQQGDVLMVPCRIPEEAVPQPEQGRLVLAEGEATGHAHAVQGDAELLELGGRLLLRVLSGDNRVVHEEHGTITLPPGEYEVRRVQEYDHFAEEAREVAD